MLSSPPQLTFPRPATDVWAAGTEVDQHRLLRVLGDGGMGIVYEAVPLAGGEHVAIKLLRGSLLADPIALQRFAFEARATLSIRHPNIVEVHALRHEPGGSPYLVMELVRGESLQQALRTGPLTVRRAASVAGQILSALAAAHAQGVVHRDLKPENILLAQCAGTSDMVKVVDFGISTFADSVAEYQRSAELTPTGLTMATPWYASPEQVRGANGRDPRVDLYAVGVLLYEMLSGHRPFEGRSLLELCKRILAGEPTPLRAFRKDVPAALEAVVGRALANRALDRYPTAQAFAEALAPFAQATEPSVLTLPVLKIFSERRRARPR